MLRAGLLNRRPDLSAGCLLRFSTMHPKAGIRTPGARTAPSGRNRTGFPRSRNARVLHYNRDGSHSCVTSCGSLASQVMRLPEMVDVIVAPMVRVCIACKEEKPETAFRKWRAECRDCVNARTREWCRTHPEEVKARRVRQYGAWRERNPKLPPRSPRENAEGRLCSRCGERKPRDEFADHACSNDGKSPRCRPCATEHIREWRSRNLEHARDLARGSQRRRAQQPLTKDKMREYNKRAQLKKKYGMTPEQFEEMLREQNGRCSICSVEVKANIAYAPGVSRATMACVDHCHTTGRIRSILCNKCNRGIGMFGDDTGLLEKAIAYLNRWAP